MMRFPITILFICSFLFQSNANPNTDNSKTVLYSPNQNCNWQLVWEDNFDGNTLASHWSHQTGAGGWGNGELQSYTNSSANSFVQNGNLNIVAREDNPGNYTSARLRSINNGDWKYGRMEARIKLPIGQGIWPAFWMMPTEAPYGSWPASGEIDIMEYLGHEPWRCYTFCHYGNSPNDKGSLGTQHDDPGGNYSNTYHEFAVEWQENQIDWFIDGNLVFSANNTQTAPYQWPFDSRFHFILNIAVGGGWPGPPDNTTSFPQTMLVDYVRVYQQPEDLEIEGDISQFPNTNGTVYSVPDMSGATYNWTIPSCATLVSGQGTHEIIIDWADGGGMVEVEIVMSCGTFSKSMTVDVTKNILTNSGFEEDMTGWYVNQGGGASANQYFDTQNQHSGAKSICIDVQQLGANWWDMQLIPNSVSADNGVTYYLSFWAKADVNGRQMQVHFRDQSNNSSQGSLPFTFTNNWAFYDGYFTAPYSIPSLSADFNLGFEAGTFCFDAIQFELPGPPTAPCSGGGNCDWQLVWEDNFNGNSLGSHWEHEIGAGGWGNGELQTYTNSPANSFVQNGNLNIVAREDNPGNYTSARIRSMNNGDWKYGRMEARIKLPIGQGIWPAFWMMPTDAPYGSWPASGEIDIMEYLGHEPWRAYTTCHFGNAPGDQSSIHGYYDDPAGDYSSAYHEFAIEWQENKIDWYIDGNLVFSANNTQTTPYQWPFDSRFHFILNIAVGGGWPGPPDNTTNFPQTMLVDYVRVYQKIQDIAIVGDTKQFPNTNGTVYFISDIPGATYTWTVPSCANLMSGQGSSSIVVDWTTGSGDITVDIQHPCGNYSKSMAVEVTKNMLVNSDFDTDFSGWYFNANGGASGTQYFDTQNPYNGARSVCATIANGGANPWDVQLLPNTVSVNAGTTYYVSFYARADVNGKPLDIGFRNLNGHVWQGGTTFNLTTNWAFYDYSFTAPNTVAALSLDMNMGGQTGTYCFDDIKFEIPGPPTGPCINNCLDLELDLNLEGVYNQANASMTTELYNRSLLPGVQPYNAAPWNYPGLEGNGWSISDYPQGTVDWVLLSFRTGISSGSTVLRKAAILLSDGSVMLVDGCIEPAELPDASYYVLVEHRNHVGAMTVNPVFISNGRLTYDFRTQDSYNGNGSATGQKQLVTGVWGLIAGDIDQSDSPSYDVNAGDKTLWSADNGMFNVYKGADVNQDGDINGLDRILWQYNSGLFSAVPR